MKFISCVADVDPGMFLLEVTPKLEKIFFGLALERCEDPVDLMSRNQSLIRQVTSLLSDQDREIKITRLSEITSFEQY